VVRKIDERVGSSLWLMVSENLSLRGVKTLKQSLSMRSALRAFEVGR